MAVWGKLNRCSGASAHYPTHYDGQSGMYCLREGACGGGGAAAEPLDVVRCAWAGDHEIPGALDDDTPDGPDFWGTKLIWQFFAEHPRRHQHNVTAAA